MGLQKVRLRDGGKGKEWQLVLWMLLVINGCKCFLRLAIRSRRLLQSLMNEPIYSISRMSSSKIRYTIPGS